MTRVRPTCRYPAQLGKPCLRPDGHDGGCSATRLPEVFLKGLGWDDDRRHTHQEPGAQKLIDEVAEGLGRLGVTDEELDQWETR